MPETPEQKSRRDIDAQLIAAGWLVQSRDEIDLSAGRGIAVCEFPRNPGFGFADYLLYLDRKAVGAIEAKAEGTLTGVEAQSAKYAAGLPANLPAVKRPLPFLFESNGSVTYFTNGLDPKPRSRQVFSFPRPETLIEWLEQPQQLRARLKELLRRTASERVSGEEMADPVPVLLEVDCAPFFRAAELRPPHAPYYPVSSQRFQRSASCYDALTN